MTTESKYALHRLSILDDLDSNLLNDISEDLDCEYELYGSYNGCDPRLGHIQVLWCPETMRAGLVYVGSGSSGATSWTDASGPEDALRRYLEDEMVG
jgi:hypothetical protein